jgi:hypothetical protein
MSAERAGTHEDAWTEVQKLREEIALLKAQHVQDEKTLEEVREKIRTIIFRTEELQ